MTATDFFARCGLKVNSHFGDRIDPITGKPKHHTGIDYGGKPTGTPIPTPTGGIVTHSKHYTGYGHLVAVQDQGGQRHLFAHLDKRLVKVGDRVSRGSIIGKLGNTGRSTGPHLHYQVNIPSGGINGKGYWGNPDDYIYQEDRKTVDRLIVIHGEGDRGVGSLLEWREKAPVILRVNASQRLLDSARMLYQVGGMDKIKCNASEIIHLAGRNRLETAEAVMRRLAEK